MISVAEIVWKDIEEKKEQEQLIEKVLQKCFEVEKINPTSLYICVILTNAEEIKKTNKEYRNINEPTDVLSFPMFEKNEVDKFIEINLLKHVSTDEGVLQDIMGDIIISIPKVEEQAKEFGHSFERELAYMLVHGFYHLRGYDHIIDEEKKKMREKEENVLSQLNITREV